MATTCPVYVMQWILLLVIVASLFYLSRYFPKTAFSVLGVLVVAAGVMILSTTEMAQLNRGKISNEDILIENPVLMPTYAGGYRFNARLLNSNSSHSLRELAISITMLDCVSEEAESCRAITGQVELRACQERIVYESCRVIGQEDERINIQIPPEQARDISRTLSFDNAAAAGILKWKFKVTSTRS